MTDDTLPLQLHGLRVKTLTETPQPFSLYYSADTVLIIKMIYYLYWKCLEIKERSNDKNWLNDAKVWALGGEEVINGRDNENFGVKPSDVTLVCLFNS